MGPVAKFSYSFASFLTQNTFLPRFLKWGPKRGARSQMFLLLRIIFTAKHLTNTTFWVGPEACDPKPNFPTSHHFLHKTPHSHDFLSGALSVGPVAKFSYFASFLTKITSLKHFLNGARSVGPVAKFSYSFASFFTQITSLKHFLSGARGMGPVAKISFSFASFLTQVTSFTRFLKWDPKRGSRSQIFLLLRIIFTAKHLFHTIFYSGPEAWGP